MVNSRRINNDKAPSGTTFKNWLIVKLMFVVCYVVFSFLSVTHYFFYPFLMLYIISRWGVLKKISRALWTNKFQLVQVSVLLLIFIYIYSMVGYEYLTLYSQDSTKTCDSLWECFSFSFNRGLRAFGGIGDALAEISHNDSQSAYWQRYWFDITAFIIINGLMLCLLWGLIMDTLSEMRRQENEVIRQTKSACFICGISKFELETKGLGWEKHIASEHKVADYMCFLIYIHEKNERDLSIQERFVKTQISKNLLDFFPIGKALSITLDKIKN